MLLNEVVNQAKAIAFPHGQNLVFAVGIERDVGKLGGIEGVGIDRNFAARMTNPQRAAAIRRRERHDQRAEHPVGFLGVPVRQKEAATVVHKQLVELGGDDCVVTSQTCLHLRKDGLEVCRPGFSAELDLVRSDLPHLAYGRIDDRRLAPAVRRPSPPAAQSPRSARRAQETTAFRRPRPPPSASASPPCRRRKSHPAASRATERFKRLQILVVFDLNVLQCALRGGSHAPNCDYETKRLIMRADRREHRIRAERGPFGQCFVEWPRLF